MRNWSCGKMTRISQRQFILMCLLIAVVWKKPNYETCIKDWRWDCRNLRRLKDLDMRQTVSEHRLWPTICTPSLTALQPTDELCWIGNEAHIADVSPWVCM